LRKINLFCKAFWIGLSEYLVYDKKIQYDVINYNRNLLEIRINKLSPVIKKDVERILNFNEIEGAIRRETDTDGRRTEILCQNCGAHLGHVFTGEQLTDKNVRHCVNSVSMQFIPAKLNSDMKQVYFAGGCFWGVEYLFEHKDGVISAVSGYMGGKTDNPTYKEVCQGNTGHLEVVEVNYDPSKISFEELTRFFFEIHDPTQDKGQGPDIGKQYLSAVFVNNESEKETTEKLIKILEDKNYEIATKILSVSTFWKAEDYHQDYYDKNHKQPYCHAHTKRF
jgi:peptide methionine sulfoxide reductase msrA/msrB